MAGFIAPVDTVRILVKDGCPLSAEANRQYFLRERSLKAAQIPARGTSKRKSGRLHWKGRLCRRPLVERMVQGFSIMFSEKESLLLQRLESAEPGVPLPKPEFFAGIPESYQYHVLRRLRKRLAPFPGIQVRTVGGGYLLFLASDKHRKEDPRIRELKKILKGIQLSRPYLRRIRACLLRANGEGVKARQFPGGHDANTVTKGFRELRAEVIKTDPGFGPCFISGRGFGYLIDLRRYGRTEG